jgi:hypothetical protein
MSLDRPAPVQARRKAWDLKVGDFEGDLWQGARLTGGRCPLRLLARPSATLAPSATEMAGAASHLVGWAPTSLRSSRAPDLTFRRSSTATLGRVRRFFSFLKVRRLGRVVSRQRPSTNPRAFHARSVRAAVLRSPSRRSVTRHQARGSAPRPPSYKVLSSWPVQSRILFLRGHGQRGAV